MTRLKYITAMIAIMTATAYGQEITTTVAEQQQLSLTIYNSNIALVKDTRNVGLNSGINQLAFKDVSATIQPETALLKADKVTLLEQNFEYDLLTPESLLDKYVGKTVTLLINDTDSGKPIEEQATVLANNNGVILQIGDKIRYLNNQTMSVVYDKVPENLRDKPTLTMTLDNQGSDQQQLELSYLTHNLNWKADYVANLIDENTLNLKGWVTLTNNSGTTYHHAQLQLVAGDVNRVKPEVMLRNARSMPKIAMAAARPDMQEETLFEYHLYTLGFPTTIKNKQQKQVSLLEAAHVPYEKKLQVISHDPYGWQSWGSGAEYLPQTVNAKLIINNKKAHHLGLPIPAGIIRTYQNDSRGNMQFIGEDRIKHTPENETITLQLGESFDVTVKRKQTDFKQERKVQQSAVHNLHQTQVIASYEVLFKNAKDSVVSVDYHDLFHGQWQIMQQSLNSTPINSTNNHWKVSVPAKGETVLTYTVKSLY